MELSLFTIQVMAAWAFFIPICGVIAFLGGRNIGQWLLLGLLLGPIALLILIGLPKKTAQAPSRTVPSEVAKAAPSKHFKRDWDDNRKQCCALCKHYTLFKCNLDGASLRKIPITKVGCQQWAG